MLSDAARAELSRALGPQGLREHAPVWVDGIPLSHTLAPRSPEVVPALLRALASAGAAALVRGGGNRLDLGNAPARADCLLSMEALSGIQELDAEDGVCLARAGTALAELRSAAGEAGWELPLDAPGPGATLGGVLAAGALGPRAQGYGGPRDLLLGLEVVLGSGEATRCGGRVVKNVTGYDLAKLYTGSLGTLGVITAAWLRLRPRPERVRVLECAPAPAAAEVVAAARRQSCRAALLELPQAAGRRRLVIELAGPERAVERDAAELERELSMRETPVDALDALRRRPLLSRAPLQVRIPVLPDRLESCARSLATAGAWALVWPGLGMAVAEWSGGAGEGEAVGERFRSCAELARASRGAAVVTRAPAEAKHTLDVFAVSAGEIALTRALKQRFDPAGALAPGRLPGRV